MKVIYFDTETTGLIKKGVKDLSKQPYIIDIGAVIVEVNEDGEEKIETFESLVKPPVNLEEKITKITKLTDDDLADAPAFADIIPELKKVFDNCNYLVIHNAAFDCGMLRNELKRNNALTDFPKPKNVICTVEEFTPLFGRYPKLTEVWELVFHTTLDEKHRALSDAMDLYKICKHEGIPNGQGADE